MNRFPENLKCYRTEAGLTQAQLAEKLHTQAQSICRWEKGESEPSLDVICELCELFSVTAEELICNEPLKQGAFKYIRDGAKPDESPQEYFFGFTKRLLRVLSNSPFHNESLRITDRKDLICSYSKNNLFAVSGKLTLTEEEKSEIIKLFSLLSEERLLKAILNCENTDGWYDSFSAAQILELPESEFPSVFEDLEALGIGQRKMIFADGKEIEVYAFYPKQTELLLNVAKNMLHDKFLKCV